MKLPKKIKKALSDYSICNRHSKSSPDNVARKVIYLMINCFCRMIDQQMHYYENQGEWNQLYTGYQICTEILFAY